MADAALEVRWAHAALTPTGAAVLAVATLLLWHWLRQRQRPSKNGFDYEDCSAPQRRHSAQFGKRVGGSASQHDAAACGKDWPDVHHVNIRCPRPFCAQKKPRRPGVALRKPTTPTAAGRL